MAQAKRLFHRLFIANRGEVAARVARSCDALGITPVFGVSEADLGAPYLKGREKVVLGPARASLSYLDPVKVVQAAVQSRCTALHPGWGFLSENPRFAALCEVHGVTFIGPPAHVMELVGTKTPAKQAMRAAGLPVIPGSEGILSGLEEAKAVAEEIGYPVLLKAESGGGGRGMRVAERPEDIERAYQEASAEAKAAFGDPRLYLERMITGGRHVEIQLLGDRYGQVVHLGERDCSIQRNHQKLIEESSAPTLSEEEREHTLAAAAKAAQAIGYVGAGTMELLLDEEGSLRFMELNARLQVEHPVTEMRSRVGSSRLPNGEPVDLVAEQIHVACGHPLRFAQEELSLVGHAIECRINAEDPSEGFRPSPGMIETLRVPELAGLRFDTHIAEGYEVSPHYDSLLGKLIVFGEDREAARTKMIEALDGLVIEGVKTTAPMHRAILSSEGFRELRYDTRTIPGWPNTSERAS